MPTDRAAKRKRNKPRTKQHVAKLRQMKIAMGAVAIHSGSITNTAVNFGLSRKQRSNVCYWRDKHNDPTLHSGSHGGYRGRRWPNEEYIRLQHALFQAIKRDVQLNLSELRVALQKTGINPIPSISWIQRMLKSWGYSYKIPIPFQYRKYSLENIEYYVSFVEMMRQVHWDRVMFYDEARFISRELQRNRVISLRGERVHTIQMGNIREAYSMLAATTLNTDEPHPLLFTLAQGNQNARTYFTFLEELIELGHLRRGMVLVMDNHRMHSALGIRNELHNLLELHGIELRFIPLYSPERNAIEFCFGSIKQYMRRWRGHSDFQTEIIKAVASLEYSAVLGFYARVMEGRDLDEWK